MIEGLKALIWGTPENAEISKMKDVLDRAKEEQRQAAASLSAELAQASFEELFRQ